MRRKGVVEQLTVADWPVQETEVRYPDCDGEPMAENNLQQRAICYATGALRAHFLNRSDVHVRGDMFIYYRNGDPKINIVPDVFVVFGDVDVPQTSYQDLGGWGGVEVDALGGPGREDGEVRAHRCAGVLAV